MRAHLQQVCATDAHAEAAFSVRPGRGMYGETARRRLLAILVCGVQLECHRQAGGPRVQPKQWVTWPLKRSFLADGSREAARLWWAIGEWSTDATGSRALCVESRMHHSGAGRQATGDLAFGSGGDQKKKV